MPKKRDLWWGYIRRILYAYPECQSYEREAVAQAIAYTRKKPDADNRLRIIQMVFFDKTHTLAGAAIKIPCGYETAKRWQQDFIREVARNFACKTLIFSKE